MMQKQVQGHHEMFEPATGTVVASAAKPSVFIGVMSRRMGQVRRWHVRDMWANANSTEGVTVKFVLCGFSTNDDENEAARMELKDEQAFYGDLLVLPCKEGYNHGALTRKLLATMEHFQTHHKDKKLFMKVDDDTFVAWNRLLPLLSKHSKEVNSYLGVPTNRAVPCRNMSHRWYEPWETWPENIFPQSMSGGPGYALSRTLVNKILDKRLYAPYMLWNEDRAVGVWVDAVVQTQQTEVNYVALSGVSGWWGWHWQTPTLNWATWGDYPYMVHHGLRGDTIACLARADFAMQVTHDIVACFVHELRENHESVGCYADPDLDVAVEEPAPRKANAASQKAELRYSQTPEAAAFREMLDIASLDD